MRGVGGSMGSPLKGVAQGSEGVSPGQNPMCHVALSHYSLVLHIGPQAGHLSCFQNNIQQICNTPQKPKGGPTKARNGPNLCQKSHFFLSVGVAPPNDASSSKQSPSKQSGTVPKSFIIKFLRIRKNHKINALRQKI